MTQSNLPLGPAVLELDYDREIERICARLREILSRDLSRRGLVVAISGGIDSSVSATLRGEAPRSCHYPSLARKHLRDNSAR